MGKPSSGGAGGSTGRQRAVAAPAIIPSRNITIDNKSDGIDLLQEMIGRKLGNEEMADMVGAPDGSTVRIKDYDGGITITVTHPNIEDMKQTLYIMDDKLVLNNDSIMINKDAPKGMGTAIITRQVEAARKLGIGKIALYAEGNISNNKMNGYYTWPRLGFDRKISTPGLPAEIKNAMRDNTMLELYRTQAGRDWWRENGSGLGLEFDTSPTSSNSQALDAYNEERKKRSG